MEIDFRLANLTLSSRDTNIACVIVIIVFAGLCFISESSLPFFGAMSVALIYVDVAVTRSWRTHFLYWPIILVLTSFHIIAILMIHWPTKISFGVMFMPLFLVDLFAMLKIQSVVLRFLSER